ncbi:glutamine--fructose-6-phosphate transaminase (isomerizing) [Leifsonia kafniensis]|uniref:Glutamine--fructose-6-phosphate aminotransferase [isomerizing] n=1 Tax=Leifsonia kafniensis TaxID=475957 RepID=A0ABP7L1W5_9MICO
MCGIIACRGTTGAADYLMAGLKRLEYRGYDSAGIAVTAQDGSTAVFRTTNRVDSLQTLTNSWEGPELGDAGIGHTRWATHGGVSVANAHPHQDCNQRLSVVHNGIIENADVLRKELSRTGHGFASEVDSEVIGHLLEEAMAHSGDLRQAVDQSVHRLTGSWAFVALDTVTGRVVASAHRSPLLVAQSTEGSFFASDISALTDWVDEFRILGDGDTVELADELIWLHAGVRSPAPDPVSCPPRRQGIQPTDRVDHMAREIDEQPDAAARILDTIGDDIANGALWRSLELAPFERLRLLACGTSLNAGLVIGGAVSRFGGLAHNIVVASEAAGTIVEPGTLTIAISQSGETADVLRAVEEGPRDRPMLALVNNLHSTLARNVDAVLGCSAGAEIGVAATKTFVCQVLVGTGLILSALVEFGRLSSGDAAHLVGELRSLPDRLATATLAARAAIPGIVDEVRHASGFIFLGRGAAVPYAMEGALKLKELTYRWAEAYPAGELKHGPLALVEDGTPVIVVDNGDPRLAGNIAEVLARGGRVVTIGRAGSVVDIPLGTLSPCGPLEAVVPLQLLAFTLAAELGFDVDKPRNLAKSVTVD